MKKYAILFSTLITVFNLISCNSETPEQPSKVNIGNTEIPVKSVQCVLNMGIFDGTSYTSTIPYSLYVVTEDSKILTFHIFNKEKHKLPTGTYKFQERNENDEKEEYTFYGMIGEVYKNKEQANPAPRSINNINDNKEEIIITDTNYIVQGTIKISAKKDIYTINFEGIDEEQTRVGFFYHGILLTHDSNDKKN